MEQGDIVNQNETQNPHKNKVHKILAHSYLFYFFSFLVGLILDFIFSFKVFSDPIVSWLGIAFLIFGTYLILWSQRCSLKLKKENITKYTFYCGPYRCTRSPTHLGLFMLILGFGLLSNGFFVVLFSIIAFFITKFVFIRKEEEILEMKYGTPYTEYKELTKF